MNSPHRKTAPGGPSGHRAPTSCHGNRTKIRAVPANFLHRRAGISPSSSTLHSAAISVKRGQRTIEEQNSASSKSRKRDRKRIEDSGEVPTEPMADLVLHTGDMLYVPGGVARRLRRTELKPRTISTGCRRRASQSVNMLRRVSSCASRGRYGALMRVSRPRGPRPDRGRRTGRTRRRHPPVLSGTGRSAPCAGQVSVDVPAVALTSHRPSTRRVSAAICCVSPVATTRTGTPLPV
ncbi:JmjC domain-containing protein [Streptomyces sp. NPDC054962]